MKPNTEFKLTVRDIELIESALFNAQTKADQTGKREIQQLLAKLYHQKNWYRPENATYISG
jgi:hypothetical protein